MGATKLHKTYHFGSVRGLIKHLRSEAGKLQDSSISVPMKNRAKLQAWTERSLLLSLAMMLEDSDLSDL